MAVDKNDVVFQIGDRVAIDCVVDEIMPEKKRVRLRFGWHQSNRGVGVQNPEPSHDVRVEVAFGDVRKL